jgi:hypothetical protein
MIATEIKDLTDGSEVTLPSNARSLVLEIQVHANPLATIKMQTSHDGVLWHNAMAALAGDAAVPNKILSFDDSSENLLQKVRILIELDDGNGNISSTTAVAAGIASIKLFFGRSK